MKSSISMCDNDFIGIKNINPDEIQETHPIDAILVGAASSNSSPNYSDSYRHSYYTDDAYDKHRDS